MKIKDAVDRGIYMATEIKMPQLSDTMDSGKILSWNFNEGDSVNRGDILAEVETDKANLEIESFHKGVILKILTPANQSAQVGEVIAFIGEPGESVGTAVSGTSSKAAKASPPQAEQTNPEAVENSAPEPTTQMSAKAQVSTATHSSTTTHGASSNGSGRIKVSPLARKLAQQSNIDLKKVHGTGPDGRIIRRDIENARTHSASVSHSQPMQPISTSGSFVDQPAGQSAVSAGAELKPQGNVSPGGSLNKLSKMRETIARRMQQSVQEAPHFYTTVSIDMEECLRLRNAFKEHPTHSGVTINHMVIKAAAYALSLEPRVNCSIKDGMLFNPGEVNIGIITALDDGLLIPVIRRVDELPLRDLAFEARAAVDRARAGRPSSQDLMGGTFSISNMGMYDVENFTAIINPGQGAVLAVSAIREIPVVRNSQIIIGHEMKVTLSVDHRIIDGIMSGNFLKHFKQALETPALLLI